jgi:uncharacterized protein (TIGR04255 family)
MHQKMGANSLHWEPLHESHSIEVAAVAVNFREVLTEISWRKTVRDAETVCRTAGITEKTAMNAVQFTIGAGGAPGPATPSQVDAMVFTRSAAVDVPGVGLQKAMLETFSVSRSGLNYQTTAYTRWDAFYSRMRSLMRSPLHGALHAVSTANLRIEYKDSFRFRGDGPPVASDLLNRASPLIAPHVLNNEKLWHSHTGFFEDAEGCEARLVQINIDANLATRLGETEQFRTVSILTAVQNNFAVVPPDDLDNEDDQVTFQLDMFDSLHLRSIELFKQIISDETAARVGMK